MRFRIFVRGSVAGPTIAVNEEVSSLKPTAFAPVTVQSAEYIGDSHQMSFFVADQHFSQALCKQRRAFLEADGFGGACQ